ncbi:MAG TPA: hypothetical protein PLL92_04090 [Alicycliphilus sp.]|nr:hypothetical protein [Alicycliphilus sp.]
MTAPWEPISIRRGDALGFRPGADYFADLIAPGLSNGTSDARWITLLSWCLKWSHGVWQHSGSGDLTQRDAQRDRYAWLRPLELLWVDRTLESGQSTGQLRGRRSIERWRKADQKPSNFAMNADQFRRYRQVGTYGAYRVVFRTVAGLTTGDGWTPGPIALQLANLANQKLPREVRLNEEHFENGTRWGSWRNQEARFWIERGWAAWQMEANHGLLPTPDEAADKPLSREERSLLAPALFGPGSVRQIAAEVLAGANAARSHADLCDALASSTTLANKIEPASLVLLPAFTRLADAAMHAMRVLWNATNQDGEAQAPTIQKLARASDVPESFGQLQTACKAWLESPNRHTFPHNQVVTELAQGMQRATSMTQQIQALTKHHQAHGGGRRWFREQAGSLVPLVADTGIAASDYRFRLRSLCLLAAQCGVENMDSALNALTQHDVDDDDDGDVL